MLRLRDKGAAIHTLRSQNTDERMMSKFYLPFFPPFPCCFVFFCLFVVFFYKCSSVSLFI